MAVNIKQFLACPVFPGERLKALVKIQRGLLVQFKCFALRKVPIVFGNRARTQFPDQQRRGIYAVPDAYMLLYAVFKPSGIIVFGISEDHNGIIALRRRL